MSWSYYEIRSLLLDSFNLKSLGLSDRQAALIRLNAIKLVFTNHHISLSSKSLRLFLKPLGFVWRFYNFLTMAWGHGEDASSEKVES